MTDRKTELLIGSLLHDVGKIVYRDEFLKNHSEAGCEFLKNDAKIGNAEILDQVKYHHASFLRKAKINDNSLAYITYIADNIASAADRRAAENDECGYDPHKPLSSVFNILNGNNMNMSYKPGVISEKINYPSADNEYSREFYAEVKNNISDCVRNIELTDAYANSLLEVIEANCSFIPSSTDNSQLADISLYDHVKITAAVACCIFDYLGEDANYKEKLFNTDFADEEAFLLYSLDISGIQSFIYTISSTDEKGTLKNLRARSFYLDIMTEHMIDSLLEKLELTRANLIYSGGGHAFLLLPDTEKCKKILDDNERENNEWFIENFGISLYVASAYCEANANTLKNYPQGSYKELFRNVSQKISEKKMNRYSREQILMLNNSEKRSGSRECRICHRSDRLTDGNLCEICSSLISMSDDILKKDAFFSVVKGTNKIAPPLPGNCCLVSDDRDSLTERMKNDDSFIRCYSKNKSFTGFNLAKKLWVGDYNNGRDFSSFAKANNGIDRICVLRADVDDLGKAFVMGFESAENGDKYVSLSRSAAFSRKLSIFFKYHINYLLKNGTFSLLDNNTERRALIVYSGGDDVFVVGAWSDVIEFAVDLRTSLLKFTEGTLKISAGIGIYPAKYPVSVMAQNTGRLEDVSKKNNGKDSLTLFEDDECYKWDEFIDEVLNEKYKAIAKFFGQNITENEENERGKAFIYNLLDYLRNIDDSINIARYAYILARLAPKNTDDAAKTERYREFTQQMYKWMQNEKDRKELISALYLYIYTERKKEGNDDQ